MSILLYINTAKNALEIALSKENEIFIWDQATEQSSQAQMINVAIEQMLQKANISFEDLDALVVCGGPGSYTGLRVGLSTAKGICFAMNLPLIMISSLELSLISSQKSLGTDVLITLMDARTEESFIRISKGNETLFMNHVHHEDLESLEKEYEFTSIFADSVPENLKHLNHYTINETDWEAWKSWAQHKLELQSFENLAYVEPYYLKDVYITKSKKRPF